jgi:EmrB/QacA subfamily drug resistance transporter
MSSTEEISANQQHDAGPGGPTSVPDHRWMILAIIGVAQLMVVLDTTIVNIALPSAQHDLGFSNDNRQWIITAYSLSFGSLLLLGGRLSDVFGRRITLLIGLLGFALASALGGAATNLALLITSRALQGVFAAILAPAALSTLNVTFTEAKERARAFGVYAGIAAAGSVVGLLVGGMLTEWLSWRWCLYVNLAFALPAAAGVLSYVRAQTTPRGQFQADLPGAATVVGGLFCLVYGLSNAEQHGWGDTVTVGMLVASAVLLLAFVAVESRVAVPLLPLHLLADRNRVASYLSIAFAFACMFGAFLFLTYYLQTNLGYSPLKTGVAFLPLAAGVVVAAGLATTQLLPRFGPRPLVPTGMVIGAGGMLGLAQISPSSTYGGSVIGPLLILGFGIGLIFAPSISTATAGLDTADAGVGSAMVNTSQQIGGAVGTAVLSTLFATAVTNYAASHTPGPALQNAATIHGYTVAFGICAGVFLVGALISALVLRSGRIDLSGDAVVAA